MNRLEKLRALIQSRKTTADWRDYPMVLTANDFADLLAVAEAANRILGCETGAMFVMSDAIKPLLEEVEPCMSLISINDAAASGIERVCKPIWANKLDHLKIDVKNGRPGPWLHLYAPFNKECNGCDPISFFTLSEPLDAKVFLPYTGPLPHTDEYKAAIVAFDACLTRDRRP